MWDDTTEKINHIFYKKEDIVEREVFSMVRLNDKFLTKNRNELKVHE